MICSHPDVADKIHEELCAFEKEREKEEEANFNHSVGVVFLKIHCQTLAIEWQNSHNTSHMNLF